MVHIQLLANDGHQHIGANRNPNLRLHGVRRRPVERLDSQMLLDPSKEQFDLPATSVNVRNCQCGQVEVVAQEHRPSARLGIAVDHATQGIGVELRCLGAAEDDRLIAAHSPWSCPRGETSTLLKSRLLLARITKNAKPGLQAIESAEVEIAPVDHVEGSAGLDRQGVQDGDVVGLAVGNPHGNKGYSRLHQVDERVQLDRTLAATEMRSQGNSVQAKVDGRGIQRVGGFARVGRLKPSAWYSRRAPGRSRLERSPRRCGRSRCSLASASVLRAMTATKARVVELFVKGAEAGFDVPQALAIGQLSEGHAQELIETGEVANPSIAVIASDATVELVFGQRVDQLRKDVAIVEHERSPDAFDCGEVGKWLKGYPRVQIEDN